MSRSYLIPRDKTVCAIRARPKVKNHVINNLNDLVYTFDCFKNGIIHDTDLNAAAVIKSYVDVTYLEIYEKCKNCYPVVALLGDFYGLQKWFIYFKSTGYPGDEIKELQKDGSGEPPEQWKHESAEFIVNHFNAFGATMTHQYCRQLEEYVRNKRKVPISSQIIKIQYNDQHYVTLLIADQSGVATPGKKIRQHSYDVITSDHTFSQLNEYGFQSIFNAFDLQVAEIWFDYNSIEIRDGELHKLRTEFYKLKHKIRSNSVRFLMTPSYIFELDKTYNYAKALHEVNWSDYLAAGDIFRLFTAFDCLGNFIKTPNNRPHAKQLVNDTKNITIHHTESNRYNVTVSKTKFNNVQLDFLVTAINAVPNVGLITLNYNNINSDITNNMKAHIYELRCAIRRELNNFQLNPFDFYQCDKRINWTIILSDVQLENYLSTTDVINLYLAFDDLIDPSSFKRAFVLWKCKYRMALREIHVFFVADSVVKIVGNDQFYYQFRSQEKQLDVLRNMFKIIGRHIRMIRLWIENWPFVDLSDARKLECYTKLRDTVLKNCTNLEFFEVAYSGEFGVLRNDDLLKPIHFKPMGSDDSTILRNFDSESDSIHKLQIRRELIEMIDLKTESEHGITEQTFEQIIRLPELKQLNLYLPYQTITNWAFLTSDTIFFPKLNRLSIDNRGDEWNYNTIEDFLDGLSTIEIEEVTVSHWHLRSKIFTLMNLQSIEFINCTIEDNVRIPPEFNPIKVSFKNLTVPLWFFECFSCIEELHLNNCPNITNQRLQLILTRSEKLKIIAITNCPISDEIFYGYLSSQIFPSVFDLHTKDLKFPLKFQLKNLPFCTKRVFDFMDLRYRSTDCPIFPRVCQSEDFIEIRHHPFAEQMYNPSDMLNCEHYKTDKLGSNLIARIDLGQIRLIGDDYFVIPLGIKSPEVDTRIQNIFQSCGARLRTIEMFIEVGCQLKYDAIETRETVVHFINDFVEPNCANLQSISYGSTSNTLLSNLPESCPFLQTIDHEELTTDYFSFPFARDEQTLLRQLKDKQNIISKLNLTPMSTVITKEAFELILKLPFLCELSLSPVYQNISNWNFLENIKCLGYEKILPRLQYLDLYATPSVSATQMEEFIRHLCQLIKTPLSIAQLNFHRSDLSRETFENCGFATPAVMTFRCCKIMDGVSLHNFSCFGNIKALEFDEMEVCPDFLANASEDGAGFYVKLFGCANINDEVLERIIMGNLAIKSVEVRNCPISENFFKQRPYLVGCIYK